MLRDRDIKNIKPQDKAKKYPDEGGLFLYVSATGKKYWKMRFFVDGKETTITFGQYPAISLAQARLERDRVKIALANGINPNQKKKAEKIEKLGSITFGELIQLYIAEVVPGHKGARWETLRLNKITSDFPRLMAKLVTELDQSDMIYFRNERSKKVQGASVAREMQLLGGVFRHAIRELRIIKISPLTDVDKPKLNPHRERRPTEHEIQQLLDYFKYEPTHQPVLKKQQAAWAFLFAIETAMRLGEICSMTWENVFPDHVYLPHTKNGSARRVPLSRAARQLLEVMRGLDAANVMTATAGTISTEFREATRKLNIPDLTFHDSRHEAATRLAQKLPVHDLAKVTGHKDLSMLMRYYNPTASELADMLNEGNDE